MLLVDTPEGYGHLWRKVRGAHTLHPQPSLVAQAASLPATSTLRQDAPYTHKHTHTRVQALTSLAELQQQGLHFVYYMHADDDSYVRLDLLLPLLVGDWGRDKIAWWQ